MRTILFKVDEIYTLMVGDKMIASTDSDFQTDYEIGKLSKENCDEIFGVVDVEKLFLETPHTVDNEEDYWKIRAGYITGFNKAMELNKDKLFTVEDIMKSFEAGYETLESEKTYNEHYDILIQSLQQPIEINVEIEQVLVQSSIEGEAIWKYKLDDNGCLILKKL